MRVKVEFSEDELESNPIEVIQSAIGMIWTGKVLCTLQIVKSGDVEEVRIPPTWRDDPVLLYVYRNIIKSLEYHLKRGSLEAIVKEAVFDDENGLDRDEGRNSAVH
ncbi:unnamed protein product [marine sediment metagenome]|uniref:Uncharacterized protein n=1 Tax=marine sediment metagenome TaxID=412755 RepID=X0Z538_9ZZZZ